MSTVILKRGHVRPVWAGHPWVYAQAVERIDGSAEPGDEVVVEDAEGHFLGRGLYSPSSAIRVRIFSRNPDEPIDAHLFERRIASALARRRALGLPSEETDAYRLIHAEGDRLPGLIVDRYRDTLVAQLGTIGLQRRRTWIFEVLERLTGARSILDRTPPSLGKLEGFELPPVSEHGTPVTELQFNELGFRYQIPLELKQKTGFYLDQRELRRRVMELACGRRVLDLYSYVGSFSLAAARGGAATVHAVDKSATAVETARALERLNPARVAIRFEVGDALATLRSSQQRYDLVVVDPPKVAPKRSAAEQAVKLMRRLAAASAKVTEPGGLLVLCSCSSALGIEDLERAIALGARDVNREPLVLERLFQGGDHPTPAAFSSGLYLSALLLQINEI